MFTKFIRKHSWLLIPMLVFLAGFLLPGASVYAGELPPEDTTTSAPQDPDQTGDPASTTRTMQTSHVSKSSWDSTSGSSRSSSSSLELGEPISAADGAYHFDLPFLYLGGPMALDFSLRYRSDFSQLAFWKDVAGLPRRFWWSSLENIEYHHNDPDIGAFASAQIRNGDAISFKQENGQWRPTETNDFGHGDNVYPVRWLLQETNDYFYLMDPVGQQVHIFEKVQTPEPDSPGHARIARIVDRNGNQLAYAYANATSLNPTRVEDGLGRSLDFSYQTVGGHTALVQVTDQAGRQIRFNHEAQGADNGNAWTLRSATDAMGQMTTFHYTSVKRGEEMSWDDQITAVDWPKGNTPYTQTYGKVRYGGVEIPAALSQQDAYGNTITLDYDPAAFKVTEKRPNGATVVYEHYSTHGLPKALIDPAGKISKSSRDEANNRTTSITDRLNNTETYTYHPQTGMLASITDAAGQTTAFSYTAQDQTFSIPAGSRSAQAVQDVTFTFYTITDIAYADNTHESFTFDVHGNNTAYTSRRGATWRFTYNGRGQPLTQTNPNGGATIYTYNADATLASSTDPEVGVTTYGYDVYKRLTDITQPDGEVVTFSYDLDDHPLTFTNELGQTNVATYDANGNLLTISDALDETSTFAYDLMDRVIGLTDPLGKASAFTYDEMEHLASVTDRNGNVSSYAYDAHGWLASATDPTGKIWAYGYDDEGRLTSMTTPLGHRTSLAYDARGLITNVVDPLGEDSAFSYDAMGRLLSKTDRMGRKTTYRYDAEGDLVGVSKANGSSAAYSRNALGQITSFTDALGRNWDLAYSLMGRLTTFTDPLSNSWGFAYDTRGRLQTTTYPGGEVLTYSYDKADNLIRLAYEDGVTLDYSYDDAGRLVTTNNLMIGYDARGDVISSQDGTVVLGATYDDGQRLKTVTYPSAGSTTGAGQTTVTYTYDERDMLIRVADDLANAWMTFSYDDDGRLTEMRRSNGVVTTFTLDAAGRVTRIQDEPTSSGAAQLRTNGHSLADQQYTLNKEGEPTQVVRTLPLDPAPASSSLHLTYDAASQISSPGYSYDARGRQTAAPDSGRTYIWNDASQLISSTANGSTASFTYNGLGDLRTRTAAGKTTTFYHNYALGLDPIVAEVEDQEGLASNYTRFYVYSPGGSLLYSIDPDGGGAQFYHFDRVGSTLFLTDGNGAVTDAYAYTPYGNLLDHTGASDQPFTYVGRYGVRREPVGGLYDMRMRYYDPTSQRFLNRDQLWGIPGVVEDLNPYLYAANNPLRYIDPVGLNFQEHKNKIHAHLPSTTTSATSFKHKSFDPNSIFNKLGDINDKLSNVVDIADKFSKLGATLSKGTKLASHLTSFTNMASKAGPVFSAVEGNIKFFQQGYQIYKGLSQGNLSAYHSSMNKNSPGHRLVDLVSDSSEHNVKRVTSDLHSKNPITFLGAHIGSYGYTAGETAVEFTKNQAKNYAMGYRTLKHNISSAVKSLWPF